MANYMHVKAEYGTLGATVYYQKQARRPSDEEESSFRHRAVAHYATSHAGAGVAAHEIRLSAYKWDGTKPGPNDEVI